MRNRISAVCVFITGISNFSVVQDFITLAEQEGQIMVFHIDRHADARPIGTGMIQFRYAKSADRMFRHNNMDIGGGR